jgi:hypothetical protein
MVCPSEIGLVRSSCGTCFQVRIALSLFPVKAVNFNAVKRQEARSRIAAIRQARRSPQAAAKVQRRVSLVGNGAKWRITNLNQVARAIAKWA